MPKLRTIKIGDEEVKVDISNIKHNCVFKDGCIVLYILNVFGRMKKMRRIPNLEAAIEYCKSHGLSYSFEWCKRTPHLKFDVASKRIILSSKNDNRDKVRKDIERVLGQ